MQPATPPWILEARIRFGDRIRDARREADLTQDQLAELAGIHRTTLQDTEAGKTDPKFSLILRLARALRLPARDLMP
ncbi:MULTISPECIES: helix-turn-helix transcriptional regulator [Actinomycetes]|uniref:HTH cro/C1-type domain-containing protein n=1 Tax=Luedemannella helvata TaxID=349315 RepID=A0ABN2L8E7_9ACTN|nr:MULTISPECIES: helix-turn-helix transcriptional regulator [Streptomyces]